MMYFDMLYQIIREDSFDKKIEKISKSYKRMNDLDEAIDWALSRNPKFFEKLDDEYYYWITDKWEYNDIPQLRIFYHINEDKHIVNIIDVMVLK